MLKKSFHGLFQLAKAKSAVFALLYLSNTEVFDKWTIDPSTALTGCEKQVFQQPVSFHRQFLLVQADKPGCFRNRLPLVPLGGT